MKLVLKIFNLIYLVFAAVAITCFCTRPYISLHGGYKLKGEQISEVLPTEIETYLSKAEIKQIIDEREVSVKLNIDIPAKIVFNFKDKEATKTTINEMIDATVEGTINELTPVIHDLATAIAKKTANKLIYEAIEKYVDELKKPELTEEGKVLLENAGVNEDYIASFTDEVYTKLSEDNATIDGIMEVVNGRLDDVVTKLETAEIIEAGTKEKFTEESEEEIRKNLEDSFKAFGICDEEGNITDIDAAVNKLLISLLDTMIEDKGDEPSPEPTPEPAPESDPSPEKSLVLRGEPTEKEVEDTQAELTKKVRQLIDQYIQNIDIAGYVTDYGLYIFLATLFLMLPWAILILVSLIRIIRPKKCWVKPWFVYVFAFEQLLLGVVLTVATTNFLPQIAGLIPLGDLSEVLSSLSLSIQTSSFIPSILYLVMIPISIVSAVFAHKLKKQLKEEKKEKKDNKKTA